MAPYAVLNPVWYIYPKGYLKSRHGLLRASEEHPSVKCYSPNHNDLKSTVS